MKKIKPLKVLLIMCVSAISFLIGFLYFPYEFKKYYQSSLGSDTSKIKEIWGKPDNLSENAHEIIYTYYPIIPLNEYKFFFDKESGLLKRRWKEY